MSIPDGFWTPENVKKQQEHGRKKQTLIHSQLYQKRQQVLLKYQLEKLSVKLNTMYRHLPYTCLRLAIKNRVMSWFSLLKYRW